MHALSACEDAQCGAVSDAPPCATSGPTHLLARVGMPNRRCGALLRGLGRLLLIAGAALVLAHLVGIRGDVALEQVLLIRTEQAHDSTFLQNDLVASQVARYGRAGWVHVLALLRPFVPAAELMLGLYYVMLFVSLGGMYFLGLTVSRGDDRAAVLGLALLMFYPHTYLLGQSALIGPHFYESWFSAGVLLYAVALALRGRLLWAFVVSGVATNLHFLQGAQLAGLLTVFGSWNAMMSGAARRSALLRLLGGMLAYAVTASPELLHVGALLLRDPTAGTTTLREQDLIEIVGHLRTGHHFLPSRYAPVQFYGSAAVLWLGWAGVLMLERSDARRRALRFIATVLVFVLVLTPWVESSYILMCGHAYRTIKLAWAVAMALLAAGLVPLLTGGSWPTRLLAVAIVLLWHTPILAALPAVVLLLMLAWQRAPRRWILAASAAVGTGVAVAALVRFGLGTDVWGWRGQFGGGSLWACLAWLTGTALLVLASPVIRTRGVLAGAGGAATIAAVACLLVNPLSYAAPHPRAALFAWLRTHTPPDTVLLVPPAELYGLRWRARRAVLAEMVLTPIDAAVVGEWYGRLNRLSGGALEEARPEIVARRDLPGRWMMRRVLMRGYRTLTTEDLEALAADYGLGFAVLPAEQRTTLPVCYRDDAYKVVALCEATQR